MKYAVFEHGGKQFVANEGQLIEIDRLTQQAGASVEFSQVLLLRENDDVQVGSPYIHGATVKARVAAHVKGPKLQVFKYRPKQRYRVRQGHRQGLTQVEIQSIGAAAEGQESARAEPEPKPEAAPRKAAAGSSAPVDKPRRSAARKKAEPAGKPKSTSSKQGSRRKPSPPAKRTAAKKTAAKKKAGGSKA